MTTSTLRNKVNTMTKKEFISLRDELESNWDNSLRELMQVLSLGSINRFKIVLSELN